MDSTLLPAFIVFGILFAIAVFGLMRSDAAAARLHGSDPRSDRTQMGYGKDMNAADVVRR